MAPAVSTVTYNLDKAGNRLSAYGQNYSPNTINQYTSVGGNPVTNGNDHEIQVYGGFTYTYMRDQELTRISAPGLTYDVAYDALGRCVKRSVNGDPAYYIYDGDKLILEYRSNGALARNLYGIGIDEILQRYDQAVNGGQWFYFQQDHEGSVTHLTNWNNGSGQIIERYRYDAFGTPTIYAPDWTPRTPPTSSYNNRFLFTGREYAGAWVYEYRARVYHAGLGRFMSEDPKLFDAGDYNLFRYCHNDPIDLTDPMGTQDARQEPWPNHQEQAMAIDITIAERISLWQKSMETSIGGELALRSLSMDNLSRQLGQGSFRDQHVEFRPNGKTFTSAKGNPVTQGTVIYYKNGEPVSTYPANSGGWRSADSSVVGNDTRTPPGHYLGTNFRTRYDKTGMVREGVGFSLDLNPLFYTNRTLLRMHPDGPPVGSEGCVALSCGGPGLRDFQHRVSGYLSRSPFIDVYVGY
jgi:RHS repeat-associated protein